MTRISLALGLIAVAVAAIATGQRESDHIPSGSRPAALARMSESSPFTRARNAEIERSIAAYESGRLTLFVVARNDEIDQSLAACAVRRAELFAEARNAEIVQSLVAYKTARPALIAKARNAEIEQRIAAAEKHRSAVFVATRNAEIELSLARYDAHRTSVFAAARNIEIEQSLATYQAARPTLFAEARNAEIERSLAAYDARRSAVFAKARNDEIEMSMAASLIQGRTVVTGSIDAPVPEQTRSGNAASLHPPGTTACISLVTAVSPIEWASSTAHLGEQGRKKLDDLTTIARKCVDLEIVIHGHTDAQGSPSANKRLSERRTRTVADYLIAQGISARRLTLVGHGADLPIAANTTPEQRARNRRIEFTARNRTMRPNLSELLRQLY